MCINVCLVRGPEFPLDLVVGEVAAQLVHASSFSLVVLIIIISSSSSSSSSNGGSSSSSSSSSIIIIIIIIRVYVYCVFAFSSY